MDTIEKRKSRFTEIVTSVELYQEDSDDTPYLPNYTEGLSDGALRQALIAHAFREGEVFTHRLTNILMGSAVMSLNDRQARPNEDELHALGLSANLAWSAGQLTYLMNIYGIVGKLTVVFDDLDLPDDFSVILRPTGRVKDFGKLEPYALLEEKVTPEDIIALTHDIDEIKQLKEQIAEMVAKKLTEGDNE
jgi:hypothetical protein